MKTFASVLLGRRSLNDEEGIKELLASTKEFTKNSDVLTDANVLKIFETKLQRTWLISTASNIYCVLDDVRKVEPKLKWHEDKSQLALEANDTLEVDYDWSKNSGKVDIGPKHKGWLFSHELFEDSKSLVNVISPLLKKSP